MTAPVVTGLIVENFKCFEHLRIPLAPLTVLSGYNGAGKSSAIQPLLLLAQRARRGSLDGGSENDVLPLNGNLARLGSAGDVLRTQAEGAPLRFGFETEEETLFLEASARTGQRNLKVEMTGDRERWDALLSKLERLVLISAVRGGPAEAFPAPDLSESDTPDVGADGRYASYWYDRLADTEIEEARRFVGEPADTFRRQLDAWFGSIAPGASATVQALPVASIFALQFRLSGIGEWRRPANVGYGLTYAFPILVALLAAGRGDTLVIDSPEAHLHPRAQSRMGWMLAAFAAAGVRLIVETHSDHVLNGIRRAVKDDKLDASDLALLFFAGGGETDHGVTRPRVDAEGRIDEWPDGFFDQGDHDLAVLSGWE